jgi:hypothetical protein
VACAGGDKPGTTEPPPPGPPAALSLTAPDSIIAGVAFSLRVEARTSSGQADASWQGTVQLTSSAGQVTPAAAPVTNGVATVQATLVNAAGALTLTGAVGTVRGTHTAFAYSGEPVVRLEVVPGTLLLPGIGQTMALTTRAYDADGRPTVAQVTWESSRPASVAVSTTGTATAVIGAGSAQITASAGNVRSGPALALVAPVPDGAQLVADAQVIGEIVPVDPAAPYLPGYRYRARLRGVTLTTGQLVIGTGARTLGGRVVELSPNGTDVDVTLALVPLGELVPGLTIDEDIQLGPAPTAARAPWAPAITGTILGFECEAKAGLQPIDVSQLVVNAFTGSMSPVLVLSLDYVSPTIWKAVVTGGLGATLGITVKTTVAVQGSAECKKKLGQFILPIGGFVALFLGGQVDYGVGFGVEGKVSAGDVGNVLTVEGNVLVTAGVDCLAACHPVIGVTGNATGSFQPLFPGITSGLQLEVTGSGFGWAELVLGNPFLQSLRFKSFEVKAGVKQDFKLASSHTQVQDPAYASTVQLAAFFEGGTTPKLDSLALLLAIQLAQLKYAPEYPLAMSPRGTFTIAPATVQATTATTAGDSVTMIVTLDPVTYLTAYAVDSVMIFRKVLSTGGAFTLVPARGACAQIAPSFEGQDTFTCRTDFTTTESGSQDHYAFVKPKFGVPLPLLLEVSVDGKATVQVDSATVAVTVTPPSVQLAPAQSRQFTATVTGTSNTAVTWTATGGTVTTTGIYTAGLVAGTYEVKATSDADPTKFATASITIGSGGTVNELEVRGTVQVVTRRSAAQSDDCDKTVQYPSIVPAPLVGMIVDQSCATSAPGTAFSSNLTGKADYTANSNSQLPITLRLRGSLKGGITSDGNWGLLTYGSTATEVEFEVRGGNVKLDLTGSIQATLTDQTAFGMAYASCAGNVPGLVGEDGPVFEVGRPSPSAPWLATSMPIAHSIVLTPENYTVRCHVNFDAEEFHSGPPRFVGFNGEATFDITITLSPP